MDFTRKDPLRPKNGSTDEGPAAGRSEQGQAGAIGEEELGMDSAQVEAGEAEVGDAAGDALAEAQAEAARLKDQLLRMAADFDNFRKRSRREMSDNELKGREEMLRELLPVFDNLERAVQHAGAASDVQSLLNGIQMVVRQFVDTLGKLSIERIPTVGASFDPAVHEAIQQLETDAQPPGTIAHEIQGGYRMQQRLIRPALVVVAKAPADSSGNEPGTN